jgi:hypothetical protein
MRTFPTITACAVLLAAGVSLPPAASAAQRSAPASAKAPAAACTYQDGIAYQGIRHDRVPPTWQYANTPYAGSRFDSCADVVRFYYGGFPRLDYYELRYTVISPNEVVHTYRDYTSGGNRVTTIKASHTTLSTFTYYILEVRACNLPAACTGWSPKVYLSQSETTG